MSVSAIILSAVSTDQDTITITWTSSYDYVWLQYKQYGGEWTTIDDKLVNSDTYGFTCIPNITYYFRARGSSDWGATYDDWTAQKTATSYADIVYTGLLFDGISIDFVNLEAADDTGSATITFDGFSLDSGSISTNYAYYLGDSTGKIYLYSDDYNGDAGETIPCEWQSKETNFVDQYKELENMQKNVHFARLYYVDKSSSVNTIIKISNDGGITWNKSVTKSIGTGDGKNKSADFFFPDGPVSGQFFTIKIENNTSDKQLQWTALGLYFDVGGEDFSF